MKMICLACGTESLSHWFNKQNQYGKFPIQLCSACKSAFVMPRPDPKSIENFYQSKDYRQADKDTATERYHAVLESECQYPNSTIDADRIAATCLKFCSGQPGRFLDIGAGFGFFSRAASEKGFQVDALEPSPACQDVFALMNDFKPHSAMLTNSFVQEHSNSYNAVLMSQVLEHISDVQECVENLYDLLCPNGICAIAVPHFRSVISMIQGTDDMFIIPPEHLNFFTIKGLKLLFLRQGFKLLKMETVSRFDFMKIRRRFPLSSLIILILSSVLHFADKYNKGMFINAYFQKVS